MASGATLNRAGQNGGELLLGPLTAATAAYGTPLTGYGVIGGNDSGAQLLEAIAMTKWTFNLIGGGTGYTVTIYGTIDPAARPNGSIIPRGSTAIPATSWFQLPGPSEQGGTGTIANPMTAAQPLLICSLPLVAVRAVLTATAAATGTVNVLGFAVP